MRDDVQTAVTASRAGLAPAPVRASHADSVACVNAHVFTTRGKETDSPLPMWLAISVLTMRRYFRTSSNIRNVSFSCQGGC